MTENLSDVLHRLMAEIQRLERENEELASELPGLEAKAAKVDAYRQVCNAQASHNWGYYQHLHKDELDEYWAQTVDNIVYAHGREAFYGRESTYQYYIETPKRMCENGRNNAWKNYGIKVNPPDGPGYRVHNVISSPIVEISGDGKTARGIWMAHTFMSQMDPDGGCSPSFGLAKYGDEFFCENGAWKMWHRRDYVDSMLPCKILNQEPFENNHPLFDEGVRTIAQEGDMIYRPFSCTRREPAIPSPYVHWDDWRSYIQILRDGYEEVSER